MRILRKYHDERRIQLDDNSWLLAGRERFQRTVTARMGSPEAMRRAGEDALSRNDTAAAVFFFARAIEIARDWAVSDSPPYERGADDDAALFRRYVETLARIKVDHPGADVLSDHVTGNGERTVAMMRAIAVRASASGYSTAELDHAISHFAAVTGAAAGTMDT